MRRPTLPKIRIARRPAASVAGLLLLVASALVARWRGRGG